MVPALFLYLTLAKDVKDMVARKDLASAERTVRAFQREAGSTPEFAAALSWLARGELMAKQFDRADAYAVETRKLADQLLRTHKLDADPWLPTAVGAAIEVHAQVLAARGERGDAVDFLRAQAALFGASSIGERIEKNLNLLNLEGKPAPALEESDWFGGSLRRWRPCAAIRCCCFSGRTGASTAKPKCRSWRKYRRFTDPRGWC